MDDVLIGRIWHGWGIVCFFILCWLIKNLISLLSRRKKLQIAMVVFSGVISNAFALIGWAIYLASPYNLLDNLGMATRMITGALLYYFLVMLCGLLISQLFRRNGLSKASVYTSGAFATLMIFEPIGYGWLKRLSWFLL